MLHRAQTLTGENDMKLLLTLCALLLSVPAFAADEGQSPFERVISSNTIKCGYYLWSPILVKDVKTGELSGVSYDVMEEIGRRLGLKIEWAEEVGTDILLQGMVDGRYDMVCAPLYTLGTRARSAFFTTPLFYAPLHLIVRADDTRFDKDFQILNNPDYKVAVLEGEATAILAAQRFPKANIHTVPQIQGYGFVLKDVALGKADVTISDEVSVADFNKNNPEKLRLIKAPFTVNAGAYPVAQDAKLKELISVSVEELLRDGWFENLLNSRYPAFRKELLLVAKPYEVKQ